MPVRSAIERDILNTNNYEVVVDGRTLTVISVSDFPEETEVIMLPTRVPVSGGNRSALQFSFVVPTHHVEEMAYLRDWYAKAQQPTTDYFKDVYVTVISNSSNSRRCYVLRGAWPTSNSVAGLDMAGAAMHTTTWQFAAESKEEIG